MPANETLTQNFSKIKLFSMKMMCLWASYCIRQKYEKNIFFASMKKVVDPELDPDPEPNRLDRGTDPPTLQKT
jgi:hypothetical protein